MIRRCSGARSRASTSWRRGSSGSRRRSWLRSPRTAFGMHSETPRHRIPWTMPHGDWKVTGSFRTIEAEDKMNIATGIEIPESSLADLCRKYAVQQLSLFGSLARGQAAPDSDADVLVEYRPHHHPSLFQFMDLWDGLSKMFRRPAVLV